MRSTDQRCEPKSELERNQYADQGNDCQGNGEIGFIPLTIIPLTISSMFETRCRIAVLVGLTYDALILIYCRIVRVA